MKRILSTLAILLFCLGVCAQTAVQGKFTLAWDPNPEPDLAGYRLYLAPGLTATNFTRVAETTNTTVQVMVTNQSRVYVTAINTSTVESLPSNILPINPAQPKAPSKLTIQSLTLVYVTSP